MTFFLYYFFFFHSFSECIWGWKVVLEEDERSHTEAL